MCKRRFTLKNTLASHIKTHDNHSNKYSCAACQKHFKTLESLENHVEQHLESDNGNIFQCHLCKSQFNSVSELKLHTKSDHTNRKRDTESSSNKRKNLFDDIQIQFADPLLITENGCIPAINTKNNLPQGPTEDRPHVCRICDSSFRKISHLKQHELSHSGQRPYKCKYCEKSFKSQSTLTLHIRAHLGQKPWHCPHCNTSCISKTVLNRHLLSHMNERNYLCPYCRKTFKSATCCRRHMKVHKNDIVTQFQDEIDSSTLQKSNIVLEKTEFILLQPNIADIQNSEQINVMILDATPSGDFSDGNYLVFNENFNTSEFEIVEETQISSVQTSTFDQPLSQSELLLPSQPSQTSDDTTDITKDDEMPENLPSKPHKCVHCPRSFKKPIDFRRHLLTHTGERPFKCSDPSCQKSFTLLNTLRSHEKIHLAVKQLFSCHVCSHQFASKSGLKIHMRIHTGDKPYKCIYCNATFRTTGNKSAHELVHIKNAFSQGKDPKGE